MFNEKELRLIADIINAMQFRVGQGQALVMSETVVQKINDHFTNLQNKLVNKKEK